MNNLGPTLLAIDDEPGILALVERFARGLKFNVVCHNGARGVWRRSTSCVRTSCWSICRCRKSAGSRCCGRFADVDPECAVVLMTAHASVDTAIEAVKLGALDYLTKPLDFDRLRDLLTTVLKGIERRETLLEIDADVARQFEFHGTIGRSAAMQDLFDSIRRLAPHVRTVLITRRNRHREGTGRARLPAGRPAPTEPRFSP